MTKVISRTPPLLLFENMPDVKERRQTIIGICGMMGCTIPGDVGKLLERVKLLSKGQEVLALQLFNSEMIATHFHILVSAQYALHAFDTSRGISNTVGTEMLLYASAQRQIIDAIQRIGVKPGSSNVAAVAISSRKDVIHRILTTVARVLSGQMNDSVLGINTPTKATIIKAAFGITEEELNSARMEGDPKSVEWAITRRVLSRISIMAVSK